MMELTLTDYLSDHTQTEAAEMIGVNQSAISQMLAAGRDIRLKFNDEGDFVEAYEHKLLGVFADDNKNHRAKKGETPDLSTVGGRIRSSRLAGGWSVAVLADQIGVSAQTITLWENGLTREVRAVNIFKLSDLLGVNARWLLLGEGKQRNT